MHNMEIFRTIILSIGIEIEESLGWAPTTVLAVVICVVTLQLS